MAKVSVLILVYNHEKYIKQCIESVLDQKTNARLEIVVGNDGSTDGSLHIIEELAKEFPNEIRLISSTENKGISKNIIQLIKAATGDFINILDGDDYYSSEFKLQKQLDCFITEPGLLAVCHNVMMVDCNNSNLEKLNKISKEYISLKDAQNGRLVHINAWLIRASAIHDHEYYSNLVRCNDVLFELKILEKGPARFLNETLSTWRMYNESMSKNISLKEQFIYFELLYKRLYNENLYKKHYALCLENFYKQWTIYILRQESKNVLTYFLKALYWQVKNLHFDLRFLYEFTFLLFRKPAYKNQHTPRK
jgi:glycosyltransferase involved in cell wall biosynthesis